MQFPSLKTIRQLQSLQGKATFLRIFIDNYAEISKVFMHIVKQDAIFKWDEQAQRLFDAMKQALVSTPLLSPLDYSRYCLLYLAETESNLGMVLVEEDDSSQEHVIYYIIKVLDGPEFRYS